jgi:hypothetical protein
VISQQEAKSLIGRQREAAGNALSADQYAACRESAQTITRNELKKHEREAAAWRWIDAAMEAHKPTEEEEAALWDLLCRARRERY